MKVFRGLSSALPPTACALTIGNFDGVHRGHHALLTHVRDAATRLGITATVMTFEPHPREFFAQQRGLSLAPTRLTNLRDKLQALSQAKIDCLVVEHFNTRFSQLSPEAFIDTILVQGLHVRWLMVGVDFCFGARRQGNVATLIDAGKRYGFDVHTLPTVMHDGVRVSSSAIREAVAASQFEQARALLGHPYAITGHVIHGKKLGRTIGFPTMNLRMSHRFPALSGIFVVQVHGLASHPLPGVASIGTRPTVDDSGRVLLETYLFDYDVENYGKLIRVEFLKKLRDEERFIDIPTLVDAMTRDVQEARAYFGGAR